ncbi:MAG: flavocytochrome c, partial [Christensenellaceae bacterium]|nr:flavocytochrome c [Christensenellaceae bacterium]
TGGMSVKRTHRPKDGSPIGDFLIGKLLDKCEEFGIQIVYNANATELLVDDANKVVGVKFEKDGKEFQLNAKAVILAAGGFGANLDMVAELKPELTGFVTTNAPGVTGDVIKMAESIGAATVDMDQIQIHPTVEQATSSLITEAVRGDGGILVNQEGKRFTNEMGTRDVVSAAEIAQTGGYAFVIFDEALKEGNKSAAKYIDKGFAKIGNTIEELAEQLNIDPATLAETLNTYNKNLEAGSDPDFGRTTGTALLVKAPYYAIQIAPGIHHTMGGLVINTDTQVLNKDNSAIEALYAAGEITGGIHGANRIGGNAVADIVVFGKQAGTKAAEYALAHGGTGVDNAVAVETGDVEVVGAPTEPGNLKDGTYTATAKANNGDLTVEVVVENGNIITISFPENPETPTIFEAAEAIIVPQIIATQSTEGIDVVASATNSSNAILEAVQQIINENQK